VDPAGVEAAPAVRRVLGDVGRRPAVLAAERQALGDKYTFLVTILIMGLSTFIVGILPNAAQIGIAAPIRNRPSVAVVWIQLV
jgi:hypothetical protein